MSQYVTPASDKKKRTALLCCCIGFLGLGGLHYFYVGRWGRGLLYLATFNGLLIGGLIDVFCILNGEFKDNTGQSLREWK